MGEQDKGKIEPIRELLERDLQAWREGDVELPSEKAQREEIREEVRERVKRSSAEFGDLDLKLKKVRYSVGQAWKIGLDIREMLVQAREMRALLQDYRFLDSDIMRAVNDLADNLHKNALKETYIHLGKVMKKYDGTTSDMTYYDMFDMSARMSVEMEHVWHMDVESLHSEHHESLSDDRRNTIYENEKNNRYSDEHESSTGIRIETFWSPDQGRYIIRFPQITPELHSSSEITFESNTEDEVKRVFKEACAEAEKTDDPVQAFEEIEW